MNHHLSVTLRAVLSTSLLLALGLVAGEARSADRQAEKAGRPNVLLILADDLGFSDLGAFGGEIHTPHLDALAAEGSRWTDFHSAATCSPTRSMLLSGVDHHVAGIGSMAELTVDEQRGHPGYEGYLNDRVAPLPAVLQAAGYRTLMAGKWHLGLTEDRSPKARGFDRSFALLRGADDHYAQPWNTQVDPAQPYYREDGALTRVPDDFHASDFYASKIIDYLGPRPNQDGPFFAYLAFTAPHWPLQAPEPVVQRYLARYAQGYGPIRQARIARQKLLGILPQGFEPAPARTLWPDWSRLSPGQQAQETRRMAVYAAMVEELDRNVGRVIDHLKATGTYDNTLIIFLSDNGPEGQSIAVRQDTPRDNRLENIGRASSYASYGPDWAQVSALPFNLFKGHSHEGGITVPAIWKTPGARGGGQVQRAPAHVTDVYPTVLGHAGIPVPTRFEGRPVAKVDGRPLGPLLAGGRGHPEAFRQGWELFGRKAYREGRWKIVFNAPPLGRGAWQLFDLSRDRAEQHDLASARPAVLARLQAGYTRYVREHGVLEIPGLAERVARRYPPQGHFEALAP